MRPTTQAQRPGAQSVRRNPPRANAEDPRIAVTTGPPESSGLVCAHRLSPVIHRTFTSANSLCAAPSHFESPRRWDRRRCPPMTHKPGWDHGWLGRAPTAHPPDVCELWRGILSHDWCGLDAVQPHASDWFLEGGLTDCGANDQPADGGPSVSSEPSTRPARSLFFGTPGSTSFPLLSAVNSNNFDCGPGDGS